MIGVFSFFAGAGFLDLGFEMTNHFKTLFVNEFKPSFNKIYRYARANMGIEDPVYGHHIGDIIEWSCGEKNRDLKNYISEARNISDIDFIGFIGGPPCPDFSIAGKNRGQKGENGKLSQTYVDLICDTKPDFFLFENVKGLYRTAKHREFFDALKAQLKNAGYNLSEQLINSIEYGAPQDRDRIILIGFHDKVLDKLKIEVENRELIGFDWEHRKKYSRDVFSLPWPNKTPYKKDTPIPMPEGIIEELTVSHWWALNDVEHHPNASMFFQPRAGLYRFESKDEGDDEKKCYKRLHRWRYSPTAAYGNNEVHIHPFKPRRISVAEALAIQTLPANYIIPLETTLTDAFKTIGNGVPYVVAKCIAESIFDFINKN